MLVDEHGESDAGTVYVKTCLQSSRFNDDEQTCTYTKKYQTSGWTLSVAREKKTHNQHLAPTIIQYKNIIRHITHCTTHYTAPESPINLTYERLDRLLTPPPSLAAP